MIPQMSSFQPSDTFTWEINRAERSRQVRWLAPLLDRTGGRTWFLQGLKYPGLPEETPTAEVFHLCFPLRDIFTADYYQCRGKPQLEQQFIAYYNTLFNLPVDFGIADIWLTAPGNVLRHPVAVGRAGWYEGFLQQRIPQQELYKQVRDMIHILNTEADVLLLTSSYVVLVECKYKGNPSTEQYNRHQLMGATLARRLNRKFHFGLVVEEDRDPRFARLHEPYLRWEQIEQRLHELMVIT